MNRVKAASRDRLMRQAFLAAFAASCVLVATVMGRDLLEVLL